MKHCIARERMHALFSPFSISMVYVAVANENTIKSQVNGQEHHISYEIWQHNE